MSIVAPDVVPTRLEEQIAWYEHATTRNRWAFYLLKVVTIISAAAIPVIALFDGSQLAMAILGAVIVAGEGLQQLFQNQQHWVAYRSAAEDLKRERSLYLSRAGPYRSAKNPVALLVERTEARIGAEGGTWQQIHEDVATGRSSSGSEQGATGP
jgi:hypothetical protein